MRSFTPAIFLVVFFACFSCEASAQSRRELRRQKKLEEQRLERAEQQQRELTRRPVVTTKPQPPKKDFNYPESLIKNRYRIDLLATFYLPELVQDGKVVAKGKLPDKVIPSLKFYEGLVIASDTLKKLGYEFDIFVYDVTDELESTATLVNTDAFKGSDLIIGNIASADFALVANYARKHNVNFVSALSPSDQGVENNPYFIMMQPTLETHCETVEESIVRKNGNVTPILFYRNNVQVDKTALGAFVNTPVLEYHKIPSDEMPTKEQVAPFLVKERKNVVLMPIISDKYAEGIIRKLYEWFPEYDFEVWGMPSWDNMPALKRPDAFPNVVVYYTSPFHFDPTTASGLAMVNAYKRKYGGQPDNMVYRGYETMFWFAYLMKKYGTIFNHQLWDNGGAPFTRYEVKPVKGPDDKLQYYENKNLHLYRYHSGSYMIEMQ